VNTATSTNGFGSYGFTPQYTGEIKSFEVDYVATSQSDLTKTIGGYLTIGGITKDCSYGGTLESFNIPYDQGVSTWNPALMETLRVNVTGTECFLVSGVQSLWNNNPNSSPNNPTDTSSYYSWIDTNNQRYMRFYDTAIGAFPDYDPGFVYRSDDDLETKFLDASNYMVGNDWHIDVEYFLNLLEINPSNPQRAIQNVAVSYSRDDVTTFKTLSYSIEPLVDATSSVTLIIPDAQFTKNRTFDVIIRFDNVSRVFSGNYPFAESKIEYQLVMGNNNIISIGNIQYSDADTFGTITTYNCSVTKIGDCIKESLSFLFIPTDAQLSNFTAFQDELPNRFPFSWFYELGDVVSAIEPANVAFPTYVLNVPFAGAQFEILSQGTIDRFYPSNVRLLVKDLMSFSATLALFLVIFFGIGGAFGRIREDDGGGGGSGGGYDRYGKGNKVI
jgi:hypothetical protein